MRDYLKTLPQWALVGMLLLTSAVTVYAVQAHLKIDNQQTADLAVLASTVSNLTAVVEYNYMQIEGNADTIKDNNELIRDTQIRLERIMGRIEARLDEGVN
jgi:methionine-rich copper-binding protein CopC